MAFDTPTKQVDIFSDIVKKYNLAGISFWSLVLLPVVPMEMQWLIKRLKIY